MIQSDGEFLLQRPIQPSLVFTFRKISAVPQSAPINADLRLQADAIIERIHSVVDDEDQYQEDEPKPSNQIVALAEGFIKAIEAAGLGGFPKTYISVYYGDIDITWKTERDLVRLIVKADRQIELYRQPNYPESPRGESTPITPSDADLVSRHIKHLSCNRPS